MTAARSPGPRSGRETMAASARRSKAAARASGPATGTPSMLAFQAAGRLSRKATGVRPSCGWRASVRATARPVSPAPIMSTRDRKSTRLNSSHTEIYPLSLHDALPIWPVVEKGDRGQAELRMEGERAGDRASGFAGADHEHAHSPAPGADQRGAHQRFDERGKDQGE